MQINLEKSFPLPFPASAAWTLLSDLPSVAACMPGAEITETVDDTHFKGKVKAKVGPATMAFKGEIDLKNIDLEKREMHMVGKGQDSKGSSSAELDLKAWMVEIDAGNCELKGEAVVTVNGKVASLGGRLMTQVSDQILNQFGKNFIERVMARESASTETPAASEAATQAPPEKANELNGLSFAWSVFVGLIKNWFAPKKPDVH